MLPKLRLLQSLSLQRLSSHSRSTDGQYDVNSLLEEASPSPTLQTMSLLQMDPKDKGPLMWLTYPRARFMLKTMEIMMNSDNNRVPFHRTLQFGRFSHLICESTASLRLMSLVHRSWKEAAQRRLRRRIRINSLFELRGVFQNPQLGPWVRELDFRAHDFEVHPTEEIPGSIDEMPRLLSGILRRCPNVTHLHLDNFIRPVKERMNTQDEEGGTELNSEHDLSRPVDIRQLGEMKYLEHLWLQSTGSEFMESVRRSTPPPVLEIFEPR